MVGISNIYIDSVLTKLNLKHWQGIYSIDTIPSTLFEKFFTIITNLAPHDAPGTHFVALCQIKEDKNSTLYLFDSLTTAYDELPTTLQIILKKHNGINFLKYPIQDIFSEYCGFYCMYFIMFLSLPPSLQNHFSPSQFRINDLEKNDKLCIKMITQMIHRIKRF